MIIAVDFDGTIVENDFPRIGKFKPEAEKTLLKLYDEGHYIIIWTCRSGRALNACEQFLKKNNFKYHVINEQNPENLASHKGIDTRKVYADIYVDDKHIGFKVDWKKIYKEIQKANGTYIPYWKQLWYWFIEYLKK